MSSTMPTHLAGTFGARQYRRQTRTETERLAQEEREVQQERRIETRRVKPADLSEEPTEAGKEVIKAVTTIPQASRGPSGEILPTGIQSQSYLQEIRARVQGNEEEAFRPAREVADVGEDEGWEEEGVEQPGEEAGIGLGTGAIFQPATGLTLGGVGQTISEGVSIGAINEDLFDEDELDEEEMSEWDQVPDDPFILSANPQLETPARRRAERDDLEPEPERGGADLSERPAGAWGEVYDDFVRQISREPEPEPELGFHDISIDELERTFSQELEEISPAAPSQLQQLRRKVYHKPYASGREELTELGKRVVGEYKEGKGSEGRRHAVEKIFKPTDLGAKPYGTHWGQLENERQRQAQYKTAEESLAHKWERKKPTKKQEKAGEPGSYKLDKDGNRIESKEWRDRVRWGWDERKGGMGYAHRGVLARERLVHHKATKKREAYDKMEAVGGGGSKYVGKVPGGPGDESPGVRAMREAQLGKKGGPNIKTIQVPKGTEVGRDIFDRPGLAGQSYRPGSKVTFDGSKLAAEDTAGGVTYRHDYERGDVEREEKKYGDIRGRPLQEPHEAPFLKEKWKDWDKVKREAINRGLAEGPWDKRPSNKRATFKFGNKWYRKTEAFQDYITENVRLGLIDPMHMQEGGGVKSLEVKEDRRKMIEAQVPVPFGVSHRGMERTIQEPYEYDEGMGVGVGAVKRKYRDVDVPAVYDPLKGHIQARQPITKRATKVRESEDQSERYVERKEGRGEGGVEHPLYDPEWRHKSERFTKAGFQYGLHQSALGKSLGPLPVKFRGGWEPEYQPWGMVPEKRGEAIGQFRGEHHYDTRSQLGTSGAERGIGPRPALGGDDPRAVFEEHPMPSAWHGTFNVPSPSGMDVNTGFPTHGGGDPTNTRGYQFHVNDELTTLAPGPGAYETSITAPEGYVPMSYQGGPLPTGQTLDEAHDRDLMLTARANEQVFPGARRGRDYAYRGGLRPLQSVETPLARGPPYRTREEITADAEARGISPGEPVGPQTGTWVWSPMANKMVEVSGPGGVQGTLARTSQEVEGAGAVGDLFQRQAWYPSRGEPMTAHQEAWQEATADPYSLSAPIPAGSHLVPDARYPAPRPEPGAPLHQVAPGRYAPETPMGPARQEREPWMGPPGSGTGLDF